MTHHTSSSSDSARHRASVASLSACHPHVATVQQQHVDDAPPPPPLGDPDSDSDQDQDGEAPASRAAHPGGGGGGGGGGGDAVVMLGLPDVFTIGCDDMAFTARHFLGVRDVPAGPHLFWAAPPDVLGGMTPRSGFWTITGGGGGGAQAVVVVRWDDAAEQLVDAGPEHLHAVAALDPTTSLLPYHDPTAGGGGGGGGADAPPRTTPDDDDDEERTSWAQLTSGITAALLSRVTGQQQPQPQPQPQHAAVWHMSTTDRVRGEPPPSAAELALEQQVAPSATAPPARELRFTLDQHTRTYSASHLGAERTRDATDATSYLLATGQEDQVVGEQQLAFLAGAHLGSEACLGQWAHGAVAVLLRSHGLRRRRPGLAAAWLRSLAAQLAHGGRRLAVPLAEMLGEARARELRLALVVYGRRLREEGEEEVAMEVVMAFAAVEAAVAGEGWEWDLRAEYVRRGRVVMEDGEEVELEMDELQAEDERGEWAPEVVELDENGREKGLISWND